MSKKVLLTGGMGYIGSHTAIILTQAGYEVEILDNLSNSKISVLDKLELITGKRLKFFDVDIRDREALDNTLREGDYDTVIHFAGLKAVGESVKKPLEYYENNVGGTINLLEAMQRAKVNRLIFSSSATVYGEQETPKCVETMTTGVGVTNPYGRTKFMIEEIIKDFAKAWPEFSATILRYFNPIGAHESGMIGEDPNDIPNNLMPVVMKVATREIPELQIYGDDYSTPDGTCIRDYIHVVDLAKGHLAAMEKMEKGVKIYNLGTGRGTSVYEIVGAFEKASGKKLPFTVAKRRAGDLAEIYADPALAEKELGWKAELGIDDAMEDTLRYLGV